MTTELNATSEHPPRLWRATAIQMRSRLAALASDRAAAWALIDGNLNHGIEMIQVACRGPTPPDLVVLPEFAFQGPPHGLSIPAWIERACCSIPGPITAPLQAVARDRSLYIAGNQFESDSEWPGRYFSSCFLIAPNGEIVLHYRRINTAAFPSPHDFRDAFLARYSSDEIFPVLRTPLGCLCLIPCGEINVPEVARVMMMQGAEVILHSTNSPRRPAQEAAKIVRAAENVMCLVSANVAGPVGFSADGSVLGGRSQIIDHLGYSLSYAETPDETVEVTALIDIQALRTARAADTGTANPLLRARFDMYRSFYNKAAFYPPNGFLTAPMQDPREAAPFLEQSRSAMEAAGLRLSTPQTGISAHS